MNSKSLRNWNLMIQASTSNGFFSESLNLYSSMLKTNTHGDNFTFPFVAKACARLNSISDGKKIHAHTILLGFHSDPYVQTSLLDMYSKCSNLESASRVFDEMPARTLVSWNSMISAYTRKCQVKRSFEVFNEMRRVGIEPDSSTLVSLVSGCPGSELALQYGLVMQCYGIKVGFDSGLCFVNSVMGMYVRYGMVDAACSLFKLMEERSKVTWTTIMSGYLRNGDCSKVFDLFSEMRRDHIELDSLVFINLISSCALLANIQIASSVHALLVKHALDHEPMVAATVVNLYSKCGDLLLARKVFDSINEKDVSLWTSMIGGCVLNGNSTEAMDIFELFLRSPIKPNAVTIVTILSACIGFGSLTLGESVREYAKENGLESDLRVQTSLIDMYCKCGCIEKAKEIFNRVQVKDLALWSAMINGYAHHGEGKEALALFKELEKEETIKPDAIVFTSVLSGCSHGGLVEEGLECFERMQRDYRIEPRVEHYSCVIDLLGRAGHFDLALNLIRPLPVEAQRHVWGPLLNGSRPHHNGELCAIFESEQETSGNYVLMANIQASLGNWKEVTKYRRLMDKKGLIKKTGWSRIDSGA
ncbi:uncharacterized protein A4U43_C08F21680 [Asparagus officinalis]|uniref:pentatricopeptide repeat-containing protein At1g15510, chloroplastic-like n=1 Tax=Asparagus officinalis TaxID=4686 RepID=UPI00098E5501|nr:pentatricopeptide repeat-containing protein At1g15510, chloroplastic-like [Asparagus officinalis]ONK60703.1 uncharacterized protein A4U43_C08F21680 [Asparagus officinalis]